jgi:hypothetical protein
MAVYLCPLLGFDVVGYSLRTNVDQQVIQSCVQRLLKNALGTLETEILESHWLNTGDGGYVTVQGHIEAAVRLLEVFAERLRIENRRVLGARRNEQPPPEPSNAYPIKARYALHFGTFHRNEESIGPAVAGDGVNDLARLLDKMPHDRPGLVAVSDVYRQLLVEEAEMDEDLFQKMPDLTDKHDKTHAYWNFHKAPVGLRI